MFRVLRFRGLRFRGIGFRTLGFRALGSKPYTLRTGSKGVRRGTSGLIPMQSPD